MGEELYKIDIDVGRGIPEVLTSTSIPLSGMSLACDLVPLLVTGFLATTALKDLG